VVSLTFEKPTDEMCCEVVELIDWREVVKYTVES